MAYPFDDDPYGTAPFVNPFTNAPQPQPYQPVGGLTAPGQTYDNYDYMREQAFYNAMPQGPGLPGVDMAAFANEPFQPPALPGPGLPQPGPLDLVSPVRNSPYGLYAEEKPTASGVQTSPWGGVLDSLATAFANTDFNTPNNFGGGLLKGFAQGFSAVRGKKMTEREKQRESEVEHARKRNEANLKATLDQQQALRTRAEDLRKRLLDRQDFMFQQQVQAALREGNSPDKTVTISDPKLAQLLPGHKVGDVIPASLYQSVLGTYNDRFNPKPEKAAKPEGSGPKMYTELQQRVGGQISQDFYGSDDAQNWTKVRNSFENLQGGKAAANGFGDIAMVYSLMHIIEPGSTVMQGERDTLAEAIGKMGQYKNMVSKFVSGNEFTPEGRVAIMNLGRRLAEQKYGAYRSRLRNMNARFRTLGVLPEDFGVPSENESYDWGEELTPAEAARRFRARRDANGGLQ